MKKNGKSPTNKEQMSTSKAKSQRGLQRETKEVLAEPVEQLRGKLELKATPASLGEASQRPELRPSKNPDPHAQDYSDALRRVLRLVK